MLNCYHHTDKTGFPLGLDNGHTIARFVLERHVAQPLSVIMYSTEKIPMSLSSNRLKLPIPM